MSDSVHLNINGTDYDLKVMKNDDFNASTPVIYFGNKTYYGMAIPKSPKRDYKIIESEDYGGNVYLGEPIKSHHDIISVERLSDGEIFRRKDKCFNDGVIEMFHFNLDKSVLFATVNYGDKTYQGVEIKDLKKAKQILFKTDDGVGICEGDKYYFVGKWNLDLVHENIAHSCYDPDKSAYIHFSTEQAAREYVTLNNPNLSVNDVIGKLGFINHPDMLVNALKKLSQEKINP